MSDEPTEIDSTAASGGGMLRVRPAAGVTFRGRDPEQAAAQALCQQTPTRCPARTLLYRSGVPAAGGFPVAVISEHLTDGTPPCGWTCTTPTRDGPLLP
jgi:hypothetical protein